MQFEGLDGVPLDDAAAIRLNLLPALEEWVAEAERGTQAWAVRLTLLVVVHNRCFALERFDALDARVAELEARVGRHDDWAHSTVAVDCKRS